jgi:hypothetical protein
LCIIVVRTKKEVFLCRPRQWDLGKNSCVAMRRRVDVGWNPVEITLFKSALLSIKVEIKEQAQVSTVQARPLMPCAMASHSMCMSASVF